jgi:hypothetical protein
MQENNLRILTQVYNGERYLPSLVPLHDEVNTVNRSIPTGPGLNGFIRYDMDVLRGSDIDEVDLEPHFIKNYEKWLETEVFSSTDDDEEEEVTAINIRGNNDYQQTDTPVPSTPYPLDVNHVYSSISHEELTYEINKLYVEQMNTEFRPTPPIPIIALPKKQKDDDEWESPPTPKKLTPLARYNGDENNLTYVRPTTTRQQQPNLELQVQEIEDEVISKLMEVESKTVENWLLHSKDEEKDGRYYFKILDDLYNDDDELYYTTEESSSSGHSNSSSSDEYLEYDDYSNRNNEDYNEEEEEEEEEYDDDYDDIE